MLQLSRSEERDVVSRPEKLYEEAGNETIVGARIELEDKLTATLRRGLRRRLPRLYDQARGSAEATLRVHGQEAGADALPAKCPYRLADLLRHDWHPASRHDLAP